MHNSIRSLALFACLALLAVQMSGLHLHIGADNDSSNLHGTHLHQAENHGHGHDHSTEIDVSLVEKLRINWTQLIPLILAFAILLIAQGWVQQRLWLPPVQIGKRCRRGRWRPPLRAPPTLN